MLLSFYEMFHPSAKDSWIRHAGGAGALIYARGPELATSTKFDKVMFMAYRNALLISAFEKGTACFLAEPAWVEVCRQIMAEHADDSPYGTLTEDLFQIMVMIPGLVKDATDLESIGKAGSPELMVEMMNDVLRRAFSFRHELRQLRARIQSRIRAAGHHTITKVAADPNESVFPNQFHYYNIFLGSQNCGYWTCMIMVNFTIF